MEIVITSMALHNFIMIKAIIDLEFKPYDYDQKLLLPNEEGSGVDLLVEENHSYYVREMEEERDWIANLLFLIDVLLWH